MTTLSTHHVTVLSNTRFPHDSPFSVFCATCNFRKSIRVEAHAYEVAEGHRKAHPYVMTDEVFEQRHALIARALTGMTPEYLEIILGLVAARLAEDAEEVS
jgi:hypothetical protein